MSTVRRIGLVGGPGSGKTKLAMWLASEIAFAGYQTEYVNELAKEWCRDDYVIRGWDQSYLFAHQIRSEDRWLRSGTQIIVSDSPPLLACAYARRDGMPYRDEMVPLLKRFDAQYPAIYLFMDRTGLPYSSAARYETPQAARAVDEIIRSTLEEVAPNFWTVSPLERHAVLQRVLAQLRT